MSNTKNPFETFDFSQSYTSFVNAMNEFIPQDFSTSATQHTALMQTFTEQIQLFYKLLEKASTLVTEINDVTINQDDKKKRVVENLLLIQKEIDESKVGPFALWEKLSSVIGNNAYFFNNVSSNPFEQYFNLPGLGYTREQQENLQKGMSLWKVYQKAISRYEAALTAISMDANKELKRYLYDYIDEKKRIESLREIYDKWIEVNEQKYGEYVTTDEHSLLYGELINSLMRVKQFINKNMDELLQLMNLPTQDTMNTVLIREKHIQKKLNALQQELRSIKNIINNEEAIKTIAKKKVAAKKKTTKKSLAKKSTVKKKISKKKVTKKKTNKNTKK